MACPVPHYPWSVPVALWILVNWYFPSNIVRLPSHTSHSAGACSVACCLHGNLEENVVEHRGLFKLSKSLLSAVEKKFNQKKRGFVFPGCEMFCFENWVAEPD